MFKIAILGCENSHENTFLNFIIKDKKYPDIEVVGVYSEDKQASQKLHDTYGVYAASSFDEFKGNVDAVIITARHGDRHYEFAKPYIADKIPMFIDKPITVTEEDAKAFMKELSENGIRVCGGSVCAFSDLVSELKNIVETKSEGEIYGGYLRTPVDLQNPYGNFFFYSQHLVEVMCEIFGYYPESVIAFKKGKAINCTVRYEQYDVNLLYGEGSRVYSANVSCENKLCGGEYPLDGLFEKEFNSFYNLLKGGKQTKSYKDFFAPVYILNAINRSLQNGSEEKINR